MSIFGDNGFGSLLDRYQRGGGQSQMTNSPMFNTAIGRPSALPNPQDRGMVDPRPFAASPRPYSPSMNVLTGDPIGMRVKSLNTPRQNALAKRQNQAMFLKDGRPQRPAGLTGTDAFGRYGAALKKEYGQVWGNAGAIGETPKPRGGTDFMAIGPKGAEKRNEMIFKANHPNIKWRG